MPANHTTPDLSDRALEIARRLRDFEPDPTPEEIEALGLVRHEVPDPGKFGIPYVFWWTPEEAAEITCPACAAGHHEQPALGACDCVCHGHITPKKPADYQRRFLDAVETSTLPLRTRRAS